METAIKKRKKSVALTAHELAIFKAHVETFHTHVDAAEFYKFGHSNFINRILAFGCASPETVSKIRAKINL